MTSPAPMAQSRPEDPTDGALFDAVATEHATIYGYGLVSAHSTPDVNYLVSDAMAEHRARREAAIALLTERGVDSPLPAAGYRMPSEVDTPTDAVNLAITMEEDAAVAWRAVVEQSVDPSVRALGVTALTECALTAARWRVLRGDPSVTVAFPGGAE
ncbi:ferritin-like domain-containing protein [Mycobacterium sp. ITM-2016-00317]|uniref:ferritin-like domain-containing protein n=1 Tax=Mycobacterium sp. ITM-2016-00317 TaxID=2099694 RepID=UPI00287F672E|nr:ferritin-like domain-containing protein [Mycobacterium sp. ITM-2016-00317]WNG89590.1 ferritin-like domain-containing protein [Mycobacterium sp. ITM-2016-00317]